MAYLILMVLLLRFVMSWPNYFWITLSCYDYGLTTDQCFASLKLEINPRTDKSQATVFLILGFLFPADFPAIMFFSPLHSLSSLQV